MDRSSSLFSINSAQDELFLAVSSIFRVYTGMNKKPKNLKHAISKSFDTEEQAVDMKKKMLRCCANWSKLVSNARIEKHVRLPTYLR